MMIVDSQVHAWVAGESTGHHRRAPISRDVLQAEMSRAGVARAVLVPPLWDPHGNAYSLALAREAPERFAVMGLLAPGDHDPAASLRALQREPSMRGIRLLLNTRDRMVPLQTGALDALWPAAEQAGTLVALLVPGSTGPSAFDHLPELLALATHPNVYVKAAGVGDYALDPYPFKSLQGSLRRVYDAFGPQRIVWASDLSRLHHPYRQCVTHFSETLPWLSGADLELIMGGNICRLLGWEDSVAATSRGTAVTRT
jgi:L-fuconolactonase